MAITTLFKNSQQQFFPYVPDLMSWDEFNGNLAIHYGQEPIMFAPEENWHSVAQNMAMMQSFAAYPVPSPSEFSNWQDWAREFTLIINGPVI